MKSLSTNKPQSLTRRSFVRNSSKALGLASLFGGLPRGWVGGAYAGDGPEVSSSAAVSSP